MARAPIRFKAHLSETYIITYEFQLKSNELLNVEEEQIRDAYQTRMINA